MLLLHYVIAFFVAALNLGWQSFFRIGVLNRAACDQAEQKEVNFFYTSLDAFDGNHLMDALTLLIDWGTNLDSRTDNGAWIMLDICFLLVIESSSLRLLQATECC